MSLWDATGTKRCLCWCVFSCEKFEAFATLTYKISPHLVPNGNKLGSVLSSFGVGQPARGTQRSLFFGPSHPKISTCWFCFSSHTCCFCSRLDPFFGTPPVCDHLHRRPRRRKTFVVKTVEAVHVQVCCTVGVCPGASHLHRSSASPMHPAKTQSGWDGARFRLRGAGGVAVADDGGSAPLL